MKKIDIKRNPPAILVNVVSLLIAFIITYNIHKPKEAIEPQVTKEVVVEHIKDISLDASHPDDYYTGLSTYKVNKYFLLAVIDVHKNDNSLFGISSDDNIDKYSIDRQTREFLLKSGIHTPETLLKEKKPVKELLRGYVSVYGSKNINKLYNAYHELTGNELK